MSEITITGALRHIAGPGPVDCTVSRQQASRIVALSASVRNGSGKGQPVMDQDLGVSWSSRVSTGDHWKQGQNNKGTNNYSLIWTLNYLIIFCNCGFPVAKSKYFFPTSSSYTIQLPPIMIITVSCFVNRSDWQILFWKKINKKWWSVQPPTAGLFVSLQFAPGLQSPGGFIPPP